MVLGTMKALAKKPLETDSEQSGNPLILVEEEATLGEGEEVESMDSCRATPISEQPFRATAGCSSQNSELWEDVMERNLDELHDQSLRRKALEMLRRH